MAAMKVHRRRAVVFAILLATALAGVFLPAGAAAQGTPPETVAAPPPPAAPAPGAEPVVPAGEPAAKHAKAAVLTGPLTREQVEAAAPDWARAVVAARPDLEAAKALTMVPPGAEVTVLLGTWCSDSRREVPRLWRALDDVGATGETLPFTLRYVGVDEAKKQPEAAVAEARLLYVPTLIVRRGGREIGRIVEQSPNGIETDLLALLSGKAAGVLTASSKLAPKGSAPPRER
jgi:hypothetical protein